MFRLLIVGGKQPEEVNWSTQNFDITQLFRDKLGITDNKAELIANQKLLNLTNDLEWKQIHAAMLRNLVEKPETRGVLQKCADFRMTISSATCGV